MDIGIGSDLFKYDSCGLDYIYLRNGVIKKETKYGSAVSIHNIESLHRCIGLEIAKNRPELSGAEMRFLRKEMDLSQVDLAGLLGVSESTIRNWENNRTINNTAPAERLLRTMYIEHVDGDGSIRESIERIAQLNRDAWTIGKMEFEENDGGWHTKAA